VKKWVQIPPKPEPRFRMPLRFCEWCFTRREVTVLEAVLLDPTEKGMAQRLNVSMRNLKFYRAKLCHKFEVEKFDGLLAYLVKLDSRSQVHSVVGEHRQRRADRRARGYSRSQKYFAKWREKNRDKINERTRKWYADNREAQREKNRLKSGRRYWLRKRKQGLEAPQTNQN
jgi:hypothetical protein